MSEEVVIQRPEIVVVPPPAAEPSSMKRIVWSGATGVVGLWGLVSLVRPELVGGPAGALLVTAVMGLATDLIVPRRSPRKRRNDRVTVDRNEVTLVWNGKATTIPLHSAEVQVIKSTYDPDSGMARAMGDQAPTERHLVISYNGEHIEIPHAEEKTRPEFDRIADELRSAIAAAKRNELPY